MKLIAYPTSGTAPDIRPSPATRDWMDALPEGFGYRCLPLNIANMHGWEIACPRGFRARWDGGVGKEAIRIDPDEGESELPSSHFGSDRCRRRHSAAATNSRLRSSARTPERPGGRAALRPADRRSIPRIAGPTTRSATAAARRR